MRSTVRSAAAVGNGMGKLAAAGLMALLILLGGATAQGAAPAPEVVNRMLENLNVVAVPKGKDGVRIKNLVGHLDGKPAKEGTEIDVRWDDQGLTFIFNCEDKNIKTSKRARDDGNMWQDETVEVFLDIARRRDTSDNRWVHVIVNPDGVEYDETGPITYSKGTGDPLNGDTSWNLSGLKTKTEKTKAGWRAEIFIAWEGLGGMPVAGEIWGFNLNRGNWTGEDGEFTCLSQTHGSFYHSDRYAALAFVEKPVSEDPGTLSSILRELNIQIVPKGGTGVTSEKFVSIQGGPITNETTTATARWDDQGLTVTVDCEDADVTSAPQKRDDMDNIWTSNDTVEVFLDAGNHRDPRSDRWMHLIVNADGSVADERGPMEWNPKISSVMFGMQPATPKGGNIKWDLADLKIKTEKTKGGWRAEIFLPWAGLGGKPAPFDVWGYDVARNNWTKNSRSTVFQCLTPTISYFLTLERWGTLMFVEQPLDLPPPAATAALAPPAPGKAAPKPGVNLLVNGDFSKQLEGWTVSSDKAVAAAKGDAGHADICLFKAPGSIASQPFPLDPGCRYRLAMDMTCSENAKIYVEGYRWKPGVKPHDGAPKLEELEMVYRSSPLIFHDASLWSVRYQNRANPPGAWAKQPGTLDFPAPNSPVYDQRAWRRVEFGVVRINVFWSGTAHLTDEAQLRGQVDNVAVERVK